MKPLIPQTRFPQASRRGVALVVTLAMVVLLTFLLVAFFSAVTSSQKTESSRTAGIAAQVLAQGALAAINNDLQAEIADPANSQAVTVGTGNTIYQPLPSATTPFMLPEPMLTSTTMQSDTNFYNLVKQSGRPMYSGATDTSAVFNKTLFPASTSGSSAESTAAKAANGRSVSPERWSAPMLTGTNLHGDQVPAWVYVTNKGYYATVSAAKQAQATVLGRIAYNIYNIGGLLDANVAGFAPKRGTTTEPDEALTKGPAVWADLRALPGINPNAFSSSPSWPPQWRLVGDWTTMRSGTDTGSFPFYQRAGWLQPFQDQVAGRSDRMFTSRQDLIRFFRANEGTLLTDTTSKLIQPLQYLTTFSRDLEKPSFQPDPNRPKVNANASSGGNTGHSLDAQINPPLLSATNAGGELAIKRRFPLSWLANVATPIPGSTSVNHPQEAQDQFGLAWNASTNCWIYQHGGKPDEILCLDQIPATREPDFFELLKAAITVGSLGKQLGFMGPTAFAAIAPVLPCALGNDDGNIDLQVLQIGANIIDQSDSDSFPTRISFNGKEIYGVENLPRFYRIHEEGDSIGNMTNFGVRAPYQDLASPIIGYPLLLAERVFPELWNPHQPPAKTGTAVPAKFRITCETLTPIDIRAASMWSYNMVPSASGTDKWGGASNTYGNNILWSDFTHYPATATSPAIPIPFGPDCSGLFIYKTGQGSSSSAATAPITFDYAGNESYFLQPCPFSTPNYPPTATGTDSPDMALNATVEPTACDNIVHYVKAGNTMPPGLGSPNSAGLGFVIGYIPKINLSGPYQYLTETAGFGGPVAMELQYEDPSKKGTYWTIDRMNCGFDAGDIIVEQLTSWVANRADPRTERWGSLYDKNGSNGNAAPVFGQSPLQIAFPYNSGLTDNPIASTVVDKLFFAKQLQGTDWPGITGGGTSPRWAELQRNLPTNPYYLDPEGVPRGATATYSTMASGASAGGQFTYGWPMQTGTSRATPPNNNNSRPVILDRPFRSVAELGMVFRDTPWRNLDMMTPESGDRALLDIFCLTDGPADQVVAGRVNLNTRQAPVIQALVQGAGLLTQSGTTPITADAAAIAKTLTDFTSGPASTGPLRDRSEVIGRFVSATNYVGPAHLMADGINSTEDKSIEFNRATVMAALADAGSTRAWNLLTDLIAQSGVVTPSGQFIPQGEARVWSSVAIDRFTGKVIDQSNEVPIE